jgi:hypothetical protein
MLTEFRSKKNCIRLPDQAKAGKPRRHAMSALVTAVLEGTSLVRIRQYWFREDRSWFVIINCQERSIGVDDRS